MADETPGVGRGRVNRGLVAAAGQVPGYALARASGLNPLQAGLQGLSGIITDKILGPSAALTGIFFGVLKAVTAVVRQTDLLAKGIERAGNVEKIESAFTTLLRSASRAREEMKKLIDTSLPSSFSFEGIAEASRTLQVLTKGAYSGAAALKQIMDVSAATNAPLEDTAFWIGKLFDSLQQGRSIDRLLFQLQNVGVISGQLANQLEVLEAQGGSFEDKWRAVNKELSRTKGAADAEAKSLAGLRQQIVNAGAALELAFGTPFLDQEKSGIEATLKLYRAFTPVIQSLGDQAAEVTGLWVAMTNAIKTGAARFEESTGFVHGLTGAVSGLGKGLTLLSAISGAGFVSSGIKTLLKSTPARSAAATRFARGGLTAPSAIEARSGFVASARKSIEVSGRASTALKEGALFTAGALGAEAAAAKASAVALRLKAVAAETAAISGRKASTAAIVFTSALGGLVKLVTRIGGSLFKGLFAIGPLGAVLAVLVAVEEKLRLGRKASREALAANQQLAQSILDTTVAMRQQIAGIATLADYNTALAKATGNVMAAEEALAAFRAGDKGAADRKKREILEQGLTAAKLGRGAVVRRRAEGNLLETPEQAAERAGERREQADISFRGAFEAADEQGKLQLLRLRQAQKEEEARAGDRLRTAEPGARAEKLATIEVDTADLEREREALENLKLNLANPDKAKDTREGIAAQLRSGGVSEAERAELEQLRKDRTENQRKAGAAGANNLGADRLVAIARNRQAAARTSTELKEGIEAEKAFRREAELQSRGAGTKQPSGAQVDAEIERQLAGRAKIEEEILRLAEERAALERQSTNPLTRLKREFEDLTKQIEQAAEGDKSPLRAQQAGIQGRISDLQLIKDQTGQAAAEAATIGASDIPQQQIAVRNQQTQQRLTDIGLETERKILATRLRGVTAEEDRLKIEEEGARAELQALQDRLAVATQPAEAQEIQNQVGAAENRVGQIERNKQAVELQKQDFLRSERENLQVAQRFGAGDRKGAQALQDRFEIEARARANIEQGGLAPDAAIAAAQASFAADTRAAAIQQGPKIVADSLQAAGGGGNANGLDPLVKANDRIFNAVLQGNASLAAIQAWFDANQPPPDIKGNP